jgi:hypothetical protein
LLDDCAELVQDAGLRPFGVVSRYAERLREPIGGLEPDAAHVEG